MGRWRDGGPTTYNVVRRWPSIELAYCDYCEYHCDTSMVGKYRRILWGSHIMQLKDIGLAAAE